MGMLVKGAWTDDDGASRGTGGKFDHLPTNFRSVITPDGSSGFKAEPGRYFIYGSRSCPWAHRTIIFRRLKKLENVIGLSFGEKGPEGYTASETLPHAVSGTNQTISNLHELYSLANSDYTGRVTVPVLWDIQEKTIVNNESAEIIRMLNSAFDEFTEPSPDYYPTHLQKEIDTINDFIYQHINNGVYQAGFSTSQEAYDEAYENLFMALDEIEERLSKQRYLVGEQLTEADWRLFTTLFRFDAIYHYLFKCNKKHLYQYPNLWNYCRDLYQMPGIADICFLEASKQNYYGNPKVNPSGVIPKGPALNLWESHNRDRF